MKLQQLLSYTRKVLDINYTIVESEIADIVFEHRKESNGAESLGLRERLFHAIQTSSIQGWTKPCNNIIELGGL